MSRVLDHSARARAPLVALRRLRRPELARVVAPAIHGPVGLRVPLGGQQDEPLLARLLVEVGIGIPCPGRRRQDQRG